MFYNILDLAAINAWILYKKTTEVKITRMNFIFQLPEKLGSNICIRHMYVYTYVEREDAK